ncbi:MAG TPA: RNA methyltransferase [Candidatus Avamphibacillus intestinigallinarum]|nr:RNA methyltransferase [Candidatus Avamphibacillus intestinigallinarum]
MITSKQNAIIKRIKKLQQRKNRKKTQKFIVEGFHLIEEAIKSHFTVEEIIKTEHVELPDYIDIDQVMTVSDTIFSHLSMTETPQGILAVVQMKASYDYSGDKLLLLDGVQDPGNVGTLIRTADAAGFSAVILGDGSADVYNDKTIRATQGSLFHIPVISKDLQQEIPQLQAKDYMICVTTLEEATDYKAIRIDKPFALVMGNEGSGVQADIQNSSDVRVKIPIYGQAESLNVAVAAGILMYEFSN